MSVDQLFRLAALLTAYAESHGGVRRECARFLQHYAEREALTKAKAREV